MIDGLGSTGATWLHRMPAGRKLLGLAVTATLLFFVEQPLALAVAALLGLSALRSTGRGFVGIGRDLRGPVTVIAAVGLVDLALVDAATALAVVPRLLALAFLARAVVVTTTTSDLVDAFERALAPLDRLGLVDAARASLALTLAIRFVPSIVEEAGEIREAQAARGLAAHPLAIVVPLVVRTLVRAQTVADAIDARGFPPQRNSNTPE